MSRLVLPPLAIYAHMPWCVRKCPYCDFNSHVAPDDIPQARYVDHLLADLRHDLPHVAGREVQTIFFGGGTPSLFAPDMIGRFLDGVRTLLPVATDAEVTLETNPGTVEHGRFEGYRDVGVTRISLGVQSFNDRQLKVLGRIHGSAQARAAVGKLRRAGFANFNLDLMYGLPEQSLAEALHDLACAIELAPTHLSHYQLTLEPGTVFYHRPPPLPDQDAAWEMQIACQQMLADTGYEQYEVSGYAKQEFRCRHNLNYWGFGDYLGLGAGAHGKWTDMAVGSIVRTERHRQPREYLAQENSTARLVRMSPVSPIELPFEFALNALRLNEGFTKSLFESRTGLDISVVETALTSAVERNLLTEFAEGAWRASDLGKRFLNELQMLFLRESVATADGFVRSQASVS